MSRSPTCMTSVCDLWCELCD